jgi:hypothetical protein
MLRYFRDNPEKKKELSVKVSKSMRDKIKNGDFTPNISNCYNGIVIKHGGISYRSAWEFSFHQLNPHLLYENIRIPYISPKDGKCRSYIVDFVDVNKKILYEVKPFIRQMDDVNISKHKSALKWCEDNDYIYVYISEIYFHDNLNTEIIENWDNNIKKRLKYFVNEDNKN